MNVGDWRRCDVPRPSRAEMARSVVAVVVLLACVVTLLALLPG